MLQLLLAVLLAWVLAVQVLRWRQARRLAAISSDQELVAQMPAYVHPFMWRKALEYALLKSACCIPSISSLLHKTQEFASDSAKRYDDTDLLLQEIFHHSFDDDRNKRAIKRMNEIHGMYTIANDDYKYVLSTFVVDAHRFMDKYGTHPLKARERAANFNLWLDLGGRMGIKDIPQTYDALEAFHDSYEERKMQYAPTNTAVFAPLLGMLLAAAPKCLHGPATVVVSALCEPQAQGALRLQEPPAWLPPLCNGLLKARAVFVYWLVPPGLLSDKRVCDAADAEGRLRTRFNMYGCTYMQGYRIEELGPCTRRGAMSNSGIKQA